MSKSLPLPKRLRAGKCQIKSKVQMTKANQIPSTLALGIRSNNCRKIMDRKRIEEAIQVKVKDGKLPCALCFKLAEEFEISNKEMGKILNEMKVKISQCQLDCFD
jgi:hypothetical protein